MRDYLGISEIGLCQRRVVYQHDASLEPVIPPEAQRRMDLGHLIETQRRRELRSQGTRVYRPQMEVAFGQARGHIDGFLKGPAGPVLFECKSTSTPSLQKWRRQGLPRSITWQIQGYLEGLSDVLGIKVETCQLDVIDRTSAELHSWTYTVDPAIQQAARERASTLASALTAGTLPEPEYEEGSSECRFCPYLATCRPEAVYPEEKGSCEEAHTWPGFLQALDLYEAGQSLQEEAESLTSKARAQILAALESHRATKARANGSLVLWSKVETAKFDSKAFEKEKPDLYAAFLKPSSYQRLELRR